MPKKSKSAILPGAFKILRESYFVCKSICTTQPLNLLGSLALYTITVTSAYILKFYLRISVTEFPLHQPFSFFALALVLISTLLLGQISIFHVIANRTQKPTLLELYQFSFKKLFPWLWTAILISAMTIGGFIMLIIPGIIFVIWFAPALAISVAEDKNGFEALYSSYKCVKGKWWGVAWRIVFIIIFSALAQWILSLILGHILNIINVSYSEEISNVIIRILLFPIITTYIFLVYSHLKLKKRVKS